MVGHHIEISNRFIRNYVAVFQIAKQCKTESCHKSPFDKGGFRGNVNVIEDSNLRPPGYEPDELPTALPRDVSLNGVCRFSLIASAKIIQIS